MKQKWLVLEEEETVHVVPDIDKDFINKEKIECDVWGRNYKKHMYK